MPKTFELDTLRMRMNDAELQRLELHQRIQRALRALILDGALGPGLRLPATRGLAKSLGVARDTVENAYVHLHREIRWRMPMCICTATATSCGREGSGSYVSQTVSTELR
ncbi:hypothetical protein DAI43_19450, partial [Achromobacter xylosoxidans]